MSVTKKARPILFKPELVRAILDRRKWQTRRIANGEYRQVGDVLWVRERFQFRRHGDHEVVSKEVAGSYPVYAAAHLLDAQLGPWRPSIFMPKHICRLAMPLIDVRQERLHDISDADIIAEGVTRVLAAQRAKIDVRDIPTIRDAWRIGWDTINGKRPGAAWADNPLLDVLEWDPNAIILGQDQVKKELARCM